MNKRTAALLWCSVLAIALVAFRSFPLLAYEQLDFDSDQAIVGLMAKHLSELRTFPLFFYGQHYMLGVQSWIAAPFVRIGGPTVAMLRSPLVIINAAVAVWLIRELTRTVGSPWLALAAVLPFAAATPVLSANLLETLGASVEPFLYVLALWALRDAPVTFGLLLCLGFLHREFTAFAVLALAAASYWERGRSVLADARWSLRAAAGFAALWLVIDQLKRHVNTLGPSGGETMTAPLTLQFQMLIGRVAADPALVVPKLQQAVMQVVPDLLGLRPIQPLRYSVNATAIVGSNAAAFLLIAATVICVVCLVRRGRARGDAGRTRPSAFCVYLAVVGVQALVAYSLSDAVDPRFPAILRYALLTVFLPIALYAAFFELEPRRILRQTVALLLVLVAALSLRDTWRVIHEYRTAPFPDERRVLADDLIAHGDRYGSAIYEDAYITTFFAREQAILTSTGKVRIAAYEADVARNAATAVRVIRQPCALGRAVASWCIIAPTGR